MPVGNRIYHNQHGRILFIAGEINEADTPRDENEIVSFIDVEYGSIDYYKTMIVGVDVEKKTVILEPIETEEQRRIRELEDALLLQAENEVGGIL